MGESTEHPIGSPNSDESVRQAIAEIGRSERHFNGIQAKYRLLASTWLLAAFAGMGYVCQTQTLPFGLDRPIIIYAISIAVSIGAQLLWIVDLLVCQRLIDANFVAGLRLECEHPSLPQVRCNIYQQFQRKGTGVASLSTWYYCACAAIPLYVVSVGFLSWCIAYKQLVLALLSLFLTGLLTWTGAWLRRKTPNEWLLGQYELLCKQYARRFASAGDEHAASS